jgi:hypothetical protein
VLYDGTSTADVTRALAAAGMAVEGIWQHEQTLEDFTEPGESTAILDRQLTNV